MFQAPDVLQTIYTAYSTVYVWNIPQTDCEEGSCVIISISGGALGCGL